MRPRRLLVALLCSLAAACDGSRPVRAEPVIPEPPPGSPRFVDIAAGHYSACGLTADSLVFCWGRSHLEGEPDMNRPVRIDVPRLGSIAVGLHHPDRLRDMLCGTTASEEIICRGAAAGGVVTVPGSAGWRSLTVGGAICALASDHGARCWSYTPLFGMLGSTPTEGVPVGTPVEVEGGREYYRIVAGVSTVCAIEWQYETWCWGYNHALQVGEATVGDIVLAPVHVPFLGGFVEITIGELHSCAHVIAGNTWCWGSNLHRQLGRASVVTEDCPGVTDAGSGGPAPCTPTRVEVEGHHDFLEIAAGSTHACGAAVAGSVYCWGTGAWGQTGNGRSGAANSYTTPEPVVGGLILRNLVAGEHFTCAMAISNVTYCWGSNQQGQLGIGEESAFVATIPHPLASHH